MPSTSPDDRRITPELENDGIHPQDHEPAAVANAHATAQQAAIDEPRDGTNAATALLKRYNDDADATSRPRHGRGYGSFASTYAETINSFEQQRPGLDGRFSTFDDGNRDTRNAGVLERAPDALTDGLLGKPKKRGATHRLAQRLGIKNERLM